MTNLCSQCARECKQPEVVIVVRCKSFVKAGSVEDAEDPHRRAESPVVTTEARKGIPDG